MIYGANASGKSNVIKAFEVFIELLQTVQEINKPIKNYNPFLFDEVSRNQPTSFKLTFIGVFDYKYEYFIQYNKKQILIEKFDYYPHGQARNLFTRIFENQNEIGHQVKLSADLGSQVLNVHKNQPLLYKLISEPNKFYYSLYKYFHKDFSFFAINMFKIDQWQQQVNNRIQQKKNSLEKKRLEKLLKLSDIKLDGFELERDNDNNLAWVYEVNSVYKLSGIHTIYHNNIPTSGQQKLNFSQQSRGTNILYALGGKILEQLDKGGTMFIDEIDTSLHPRLAKFLVLLFQHPKSNPKMLSLFLLHMKPLF